MLAQRHVNKLCICSMNTARPQHPKRLSQKDCCLLKEVVAKEKEESQPNPMSRSIGKTRNVMPVARKATLCPIVHKTQKKKKRMITNQEQVQQAALRSCVRM